MKPEASAGETFGPALRRRRLEAGLTLGELARLTHYSKSHLSKVERDQKDPSVSFARLLDETLGANGELAGHRSLNTPKAAAPATIIVAHLSSEGAHLGDEYSVSRLLINSAKRLPPMDKSTGETTLFSLKDLYGALRHLGQTLGPGILLTIAIPQFRTVRALADAATDASVQKEAWKLASNIADYVGWMAQESGDDRQALWWIAQASEFAEHAGDEEMTAHSYVRRALIAMYQNDSVATVDLARRAQQLNCPPRIKWLGALREAQGHALAGDFTAYSDALINARRYRDSVDSEREPATGDLHAGPSSEGLDPAALAIGWSLHDLGRSNEAVDVLEVEFNRIDSARIRSRARVGARLALAYATTKQIDKACHVIQPILVSMHTIESATIKSDLRSLARVLGRWRTDTHVQQIMPQLSAALSPRTPL